MKREDGMRECARVCMQNKRSCMQVDCRQWIKYEDEQNCTLISIYENGRMTLRQVAERLAISFARVKQIETQALEKLRRRCLNKGIIF